MSCFVALFFSCSKEDDSLSTRPTSINKSQINYTYILDGVSYPVVLNEKKDGSFDLNSAIDEKLSNALDCPNSTLLKDPFNENTYYVFKSENESNRTSLAIVRRISRIEKGIRKNRIAPHLLSREVGDKMLNVYADRNFVGRIDEYCSDIWLPAPYITPDGGFPTLGRYNDLISSYKLYSTYGQVVVRFYQDSNYGGRVLTAYSYREGIMYGDVAWQDANLHSTLMQGGFNRKYWGDQISSIRWTIVK